MTNDVEKVVERQKWFRALPEETRCTEENTARRGYKRSKCLQAHKVSLRVKRGSHLKEFRTLLRSIAFETRDLVVLVHITEEMEREANGLAIKCVEIVKRKRIPDTFEGSVITKAADYLGQFVFHDWLSGDWRKALPYIESELRQMREGRGMDVKDAEIDGKSVEIKTTDFRRGFLVHAPIIFGLSVPETQAKRKIYDLYVFVLLIPRNMQGKYGADAAIYGYAYGDEIRKTQPKLETRWRTAARLRHFIDLHPIRFLKPRLWNGEDARRTTLKDAMSKKARHYSELLFRMATIDRSRSG